MPNRPGLTAGHRPGREDVSCSVRQVGPGRSTVELDGAFRPGWLALLGMRLAERDVSVELVRAKRHENGRWHAELEVQSAPGTSPNRIDYAALAVEDGRVDGAGLIIERFAVQRDPGRPGGVVLHVEAVDSLGLLGRLLATLSLAMLFPQEVWMRTERGRAYDTLWLMGSNDSIVSDDAVRFLSKLMSGALR